MSQTPSWAGEHVKSTSPARASCLVVGRTQRTDEMGSALREGCAGAHRGKPL